MKCCRTSLIRFRRWRTMPILRDDMITEALIRHRPKHQRGKRVEFGCGDVEEGFEQADVIVERDSDESRSPGLYRAARLRRKLLRGRHCRPVLTGHFVVRGHCAKLVISLQTPCYFFGNRWRIWRQDGCLSRTAGSHALEIGTSAGQDDHEPRRRHAGYRPNIGGQRLGQDGCQERRHACGRRYLEISGGRFRGLSSQPGCMCAFAPYDMDNVKVVGFDVVTNRPRLRPTGTRCADFRIRGRVRSRRIGTETGDGSVELRQKNEAKEAPAPLTVRNSARSVIRNCCRKPKVLSSTIPRLVLIRAVVWHRAFGSTSAASLCALQLNVDGTSI